MLITIFEKFSKKMDTVEKYILVIPMCMFALGVVVDVLCRKLFHINLYFLQELGKYLMVFATFVGASMGVKTKSHPNMSAVVDALPPKGKIILVIISNIICAGAMFFAGYWSWVQFGLYRKMGTMTSTLGSIPVYVLYLVVPVALTIMGVRFLIQCYLEPRDIAKTAGKGGK